MSISQNSGKTHNVCIELVYFTTCCGLVSLGSFSLVFEEYMFHEIVHMFAWMLKSVCGIEIGLHLYGCAYCFVFKRRERYTKWKKRRKKPENTGPLRTSKLVFRTQVCFPIEMEKMKKKTFAEHEDTAYRWTDHGCSIWWKEILLVA